MPAKPIFDMTTTVVVPEIWQVQYVTLTSESSEGNEKFVYELRDREGMIIKLTEEDLIGKMKASHVQSIAYAVISGRGASQYIVDYVHPALKAWATAVEQDMYERIDELTAGEIEPDDFLIAE